MDVVLIVALVVAWGVVAFEGWLIYVLVKQHGRTLLAQGNLTERLAAVEAALAERPAHDHAEAPQGLELGSPAPDFALPDLEGRERTLREFLGEPLLVTFFSTGCGFCREMAPELGKLPEGAPRVLLVSRGDVDEHKKLAQEHGWNADIVVEDGFDVLHAYKATGTPTGYLLDAEGKTATPLVIGSQALLDVVRSYAEHGNGSGSNGRGNGATTERARAATLPTRDVSESRIARDGLEPGKEAPEFTLPDLDGRERSLHEFRGRRVLLVFSAPDCVPCDALAPDLVRLQETHGDDLQVVMIGRGHFEANRAKAEEHRFPFPVLVQKSWEISKRYAKFGTPIGYLIDERGIIAKPVAVGRDAILQLVESEHPRRRGLRRRARSK